MRAGKTSYAALRLLVGTRAFSLAGRHVEMIGMDDEPGGQPFRGHKSIGLHCPSRMQTTGAKDRNRIRPGIRGEQMTAVAGKRQRIRLTAEIRLPGQARVEDAGSF